MNRRSFFKNMVGGLAATAAVRTWPFRVFSFPTEIKIARTVAPDILWNASWWGGIPIVESSYCPPDRIYLINGNYVGTPAALDVLLSKAGVPRTRTA